MTVARIEQRTAALAAVALALAALVGAAVAVYPLAVIGLAGIGVAVPLVGPVLRQLRVGAVGGAFAVAVAVGCLVPSTNFEGTARVVPALAVLGLFAAAFLIEWRIPRIGAPGWLLLGLLAVAVLAEPTYGSVRKLLPGAILVMIGYVGVQHVDRRKAMRWIVALAVVEVGVAFAQAVGGVELPWDHLAPGWGTNMLDNQILGSSWRRAQGTLGHPLPLSLLLAMAAAIVARGGDLYGRRTRVVLLAILTVGVIIAGSRSGTLATAAVVILFSGYRPSLQRVMVGLYVLAVLALAFVALNITSTSAWQHFVSSGSVTHRQGAFAAIPTLVSGQDIRHLFIGNGWDSLPSLYSRGLLQTDNFGAVDNQFVATVAVAGFVGLVLLLAVIVRLLRSTDRQGRLPLLMATAMFLVFDVLLWHSGFMLFGVACGLAQDGTRRTG